LRTGPSFGISPVRIHNASITKDDAPARKMGPMWYSLAAKWR
jgi:hypothetical protein